MCVCIPLFLFDLCKCQWKYACPVLLRCPWPWRGLYGVLSCKTWFPWSQSPSNCFLCMYSLCCRSVPATHLQFEARYCGQWEMFSFQKLWAAPTACNNVPKLLWNECAASMRGGIPRISIDSPVRSMAGSSADSLCMQLWPHIRHRPEGSTWLVTNTLSPGKLPKT